MAPDILLPIFVAVPLTASVLAVILPSRMMRDLLHIIVPFAGILGWPGSDVVRDRFEYRAR